MLAALIIEPQPAQAEPDAEVAEARPCASMHSPVLGAESTA
jgi:hypothetical protein